MSISLPVVVCLPFYSSLYISLPVCCRLSTYLSFCSSSLSLPLSLAICLPASPTTYLCLPALVSVFSCVSLSTLPATLPLSMSNVHICLSVHVYLFPSIILSFCLYISYFCPHIVVGLVVFLPWLDSAVSVFGYGLRRLIGVTVAHARIRTPRPHLCGLVVGILYLRHVALQHARINFLHLHLKII